MATDAASPVPSRWRDPDHDPAPWTLHLTRHFGAPSADPVRRAAVQAGLTQGDPLADALITWMKATKGEGWRKFDLALTKGIDAVPDAPPPLADFFAHIDRRPDWVEGDLMRIGCRAIALEQ